jgi:3-hexulose-6-phosphate synthase
MWWGQIHMNTALDDNTLWIKPLLQIAMDYVEGDEVLLLAESVREYADILDIGTLLLKKEGLGVIKKVKQAFPDKLVFADTRTLDLGQLEARAVFAAGADMMSVCSIASDTTIEQAIQEARVLGKKVLVELIGMFDFRRQMKRLCNFQPNYIAIHIGIDERHTDDPLFDRIECISPITRLPLAIAGGIKLDDIPYLLVFQPAIIVVGAAITKSPDPQDAAKEFWERIHAMSNEQ